MKGIRLLHAAPLLALALAATAPRAAQAAAAKVGCMRVEVSSLEETKGQPNDKFSATRTIDLTFSVAFDPALAGAHTVELRLFGPEGYLYQSIAVPMAAPGNAPRERMVEGYPRPLKEKAPRPGKSQGREVLFVDIPFPVAGTLIVSNGLYGKWTVQAYVDGETSPCSPVQQFWIQP